MMLRVFIALAALAGPFVLYALYLRLARRSGSGRWPLTILFLVGALLAAETFLLNALQRPNIQGRFEPARLEDGVVRPGRIIPEEGR